MGDPSRRCDVCHGRERARRVAADLLGIAGYTGSGFSPAHSRPEVASFDNSTTTTPQEYPGGGRSSTTSRRSRRPTLTEIETWSCISSSSTLMAHAGDRAERCGLSAPRFISTTASLSAGHHREVVAHRKPHRQAITLETHSRPPGVLPHGEGYGWHYLTGHWGSEWQLHSEPLQTGAHVIESRRGSTSHQANPWFAIDRAGQTTEENGPVWFGALGWSGSWRITVEQTAMHQVRVTGGFNPFDFGYGSNPANNWRRRPSTLALPMVAWERRRVFFTASSGVHSARWKQRALASCSV